MDNIRPIRTDEDLAWAIGEIGRYFDALPEAGTAEADRFDVLADLIEAYENRTYPITAPEPVEMIKAHMEMTGRGPADLARLFGSRSRASEVLGRKRRLTVEMIRRLDREWRVPAEFLVEPYRLGVA